MDTSFFVALSFVDDEYHGRAVALFPEIVKGDYGKPVCTSYAVLCETVAIIQRNCGGVDKKRRACKIAYSLFNIVEEFKIELSCVDLDIYGAAKALYIQMDGNLDFVDALIVVFSRINKIEYIASFDGDYDQFAGEGIRRLC